ncbi:hypothetical protein M501DRAFT_996629 [Patellaria atrata CBS 101060]|uniref:Uncharacterized protein n=1 Tax=Patellaria atrata CBS 101060 TaxID=1346257 RepID=A0A9P4S686_9PEZI|nr:hypothetical protein M501DRAFT_996629 [Patellaria atrata CBS 101060]
MVPRPPLGDPSSKPSPPSSEYGTMSQGYPNPSQFSPFPAGWSGQWPHPPNPFPLSRPPPSIHQNPSFHGWSSPHPPAHPPPAPQFMVSVQQHQVIHAQAPMTPVPSAAQCPPPAVVSAPPTPQMPYGSFHHCSECHQLRSKRFHREHPLIPGQIPPPGVCRRCTGEHRSESEKIKEKEKPAIEEESVQIMDERGRGFSIHDRRYPGTPPIEVIHIKRTMSDEKRPRTLTLDEVNMREKPDEPTKSEAPLLGHTLSSAVSQERRKSEVRLQSAERYRHAERRILSHPEPFKVVPHDDQLHSRPPSNPRGRSPRRPSPPRRQSSAVTSYFPPESPRTQSYKATAEPQRIFVRPSESPPRYRVRYREASPLRSILRSTSGHRSTSTEHRQLPPRNDEPASAPSGASQVRFAHGTFTRRRNSISDGQDDVAPLRRQRYRTHVDGQGSGDDYMQGMYRQILEQ